MNDLPYRGKVRESFILFKRHLTRLRDDHHFRRREEMNKTIVYFAIYVPLKDTFVDILNSIILMVTRVPVS